MDNPYKDRKCSECADIRYDEEIGYYCSDDSESLLEGCGTKPDMQACPWFTEKSKEIEDNNEKNKL